ncbi:MAG: hypothetical protein HZC54_00695 [Verrucomicrobia bacterium]|nr:hypothetical protein [Verrucomicrobiota bacterium]
MNKESRWNWITIGRAQRGWTVEVEGAIEAHTQASWRRDKIASGAHRWLVAAIILAFMDWRRQVQQVRNIPGPFNNRDLASQ